MEPIVISRDSFRSHWELLHDTKIPDIYTQRVDQLRDTYTCFRGKSAEAVHDRRNGSKGHGRNRKDHGQDHGSMNFPTAGSMRPRIGLLFTNKEEKARKNFVAFMNKLSPQNKGEILSNFVRSLVPENVPIYMDQIIRLFQVQPTYHDLYMEVLLHIITVSPETSVAFLEEKFHHFVTEKEYIVPVGMLEDVNIEDHGEDSFCNYTKWKKQIKSLLILYIRLLANKVFGKTEGIEWLMDHLGSICEEKWRDVALVDIYLDMIHVSVQAISQYMPQGIHSFPSLLDRYKEWDQRKDMLGPSSRFKILDILECMRPEPLPEHARTRTRLDTHKKMKDYKKNSG